MADWVWWFAAAGALVAVEIMTGTFYLLMLAFALAAGGVAALTGLGAAFQFMIVGTTGVIATLLLKKSRFGSKGGRNPAEDPDMNPDIGKRLIVEEWQPMPDGSCRARVSYRGTMWDVELGGGGTPDAGAFIIREVRANRLIVANITE